MFGYVRIYDEELKLKQIKLYKKYYCAECNELRRNYGRIATFFLSYEMVFTLILLDGFSTDESSQEYKLSCQFEAIRLGEISICQEILHYVAWQNMYLTEWKLIDNWKDDKNIIAYLLHKLLFSKRRYKEDCKKYKEIHEVLEREFVRFYSREKEHAGFDELAELMGNVWGELIGYGAKIVGVGEETKNALEEICSDMAKFLYCVDAFDDYENDIKKAKFNPLADVRKEYTEIYQDSLSVLSLIIFSLKRKVILIDKNRNYEILNNIVSLGLEQKVRAIIKGKREKSERKTITN